MPPTATTPAEVDDLDVVIADEESDFSIELLPTRPAFDVPQATNYCSCSCW